MSRKQFDLIASTIRDLDSGVNAETYGRIRKCKRLVAESFADALEETNPRFDRARFLKECGL